MSESEHQDDSVTRKEIVEAVGMPDGSFVTEMAYVQGRATSFKPIKPGSAVKKNRYPKFVIELIRMNRKRRGLL